MSFRDLIKQRANEGGSVVNSILAEKGARVEFLVIRDDEGTCNFFYVIMAEGEYQKMQRDVSELKPITPADYGFVLYQGFGEEAPDGMDEVLQEIFQ